MLVLDEPPCLSLVCSMLLKSPAIIQCASGRSVLAKWFHSIALGPVRLKPYTLIMPIVRSWLSLIVMYWARPGYRTPWSVMELVKCSAMMIPVPPLYLVVRGEKELSFQRLVPFLNSTLRACFKHASSGNFTSCSRRMSVGGFVCRNKSLISLLFLCHVKPWPSPRTFWVAIVSLSPFII